jgi:hypothetical protein
MSYEEEDNIRVHGIYHHSQYHQIRHQGISKGQGEQSLRQQYVQQTKKTAPGNKKKVPGDQEGAQRAEFAAAAYYKKKDQAIRKGHREQSLRRQHVGELLPLPFISILLHCQYLAPFRGERREASSRLIEEEGNCMKP